MTDARCHDCCRPYDDYWADLVMPHDDWRKISPDGQGNGLLCASCMVERCIKVGLTTTAVWRSGPFADGEEALIAERDRLRADLAAAEARLAPIVALAEQIRDDAAKATKGPWKLVASDEDWTTFDLVHRDEAGKAVYVASDVPGIANARLIAAASDMAAAILAAGGQQTEYERKLAQAKKDFPNGF